MKVKEVLLLILLVFAGVVFYHLQTGKWRDLAPWADDIMFWGKSYVYEQTEEIPLSETYRLEIENRHGDVEVVGQEGRTSLEATLRKEIRRRNEAEAVEIADRLSTVVSRKGDLIRITTNRADFRKQNFRTHFRILAPPATAVDIRNSHGNIKVLDLGRTAVVNRHGRVRAAGIAGDADIANSHGAIELEDIEGGAAAATRHADVRIRTVGGDLSVTNSFGRIRVEDIGGKTAISGRHNAVIGHRLEGPVRISNTHDKISLEDTGPAEIEGYHSDVTVRGARGRIGIATQHGRVTLENIRGGAEVKGRNVRVRGRHLFDGSIRIDTSHEKCDLDDFSGDAEINVSNGEINLSPLSPEDGLRVSGRYGAVRVLWPRGAAVSLEARARNGRVIWRLSGPAPFMDSNGTSLVRAFMAEGEEPRVVLSSQYGDIRIEERPTSRD